jgi:hypothetical protein
MLVLPARDSASFPVSASYDFTGSGGRNIDTYGKFTSSSLYDNVANGFSFLFGGVIITFAGMNVFAGIVHSIYIYTYRVERL